MERVFGPYAERGGKVWRVTIQVGRGRSADRKPHCFTDEAAAKEFASKARAQIGAKTVESAFEDYLEHLVRDGRRPGTITTARYRLRGLFEPVLGLPLRELNEKRAQKLYDAYTVGRAPDTHQGALFLAKSCFEWLRRKAKLVRWNPFDDVDPIGRKNKGKPQLKKDDTRKLYRWLCVHAATDDRACAALMALTLGLRAHEVVGRTADHLDNDGTELMVTVSKTKAGVRAVRLPEVLQTALGQRAKTRTGRLLPYKAPWVRTATEWCCEQAGVAPVCAQALRGMYATATLEAGIDPNAVARSLGHTNAKITRAAYAAAGSEQSSKTARVVGTLEEKVTAARTALTELPN